ncbi:unnamed protein product [Pleuronectes platessa]|uniref:Uncharacterized protein n=1 Tax=Pleuronectes platessa TaxID=8262 RepID=A0A9N7TYU0_PLEPL|nr:unnamed protein product [Pleuronectes platessa]
MAHGEVWSNAAVGQQEREGWVGAEQKGLGEDSRAHSLPTPAPGHYAHSHSAWQGPMEQHLVHIPVMAAALQGAHNAGNAAVTTRNFWIAADAHSRFGDAEKSKI